MIGNGPLTSSKFLYPHLPYDPVKDLAPLAMIGSAPLVLVAPRSLVTQDAAAYLQSLKQRKDGNYASVGTGSGGHLGMELVQQALGLDLQHVPYNGGLWQSVSASAAPSRPVCLLCRKLALASSILKCGMP